MEGYANEMSVLINPFTDRNPDIPLIISRPTLIWHTNLTLAELYKNLGLCVDSLFEVWTNADIKKILFYNADEDKKALWTAYDTFLAGLVDQLGSKTTSTLVAQATLDTVKQTMSSGLGKYLTEQADYLNSIYTLITKTNVASIDPALATLLKSSSPNFLVFFYCNSYLYYIATHYNNTKTNYESLVIFNYKPSLMNAFDFKEYWYVWVIGGVLVALLFWMLFKKK